MTGRPFNGATPEERKQYRARNSKLRKAGLLPPQIVPIGPVQEHVRKLHEHPDGGMAFVHIATAAGVGQSTVSEIMSGVRKKGTYADGTPHEEPFFNCHRRIAVALMSVQYETPNTPRGARMSGVGVHRRIDALQCMGYTATFLAIYLGYPHSSKNYIASLRQNRYTHVDVWRRVSEAYQKLRDQDPADHGICTNSVNRIRNAALRRGGAPAHCWDEDTIDDPAAIAEWTGACGSMLGWQIHCREEIRMCHPCQAAHDARDLVPHSLSDHDMDEKTGYCASCLRRVDFVIHRSTYGKPRYRCGPHIRRLHQERRMKNKVLKSEVIRLTKEEGKSAKEIALMLDLANRTVVRYRHG